MSRRFVLQVEMQVPATALVGKTSLVLALAVDSRWNRTEDPLWGAGSFWNQGGAGEGGVGGDGYSFGGFGGIVGHAEVQLRERAWIDDSIHVTTTQSQNGTWQVAIALELTGTVDTTDVVTLSVCGWNFEMLNGCLFASTSAPLRSHSRVQLAVSIAAARLWVPGTTSNTADLYLANVTLTNPSTGPIVSLDTRSVRFGVRSIDTDGPRIVFNGEALFLRGYGDDGQYGVSMAPPMDKGFYLAQLRMMKALGYNYVRYKDPISLTLSWCLAIFLRAEQQQLTHSRCATPSQVAHAFNAHGVFRRRR
jgi:hypothetical protein